MCQPFKRKFTKKLTKELIEIKEKTEMYKNEDKNVRKIENVNTSKYEQTKIVTKNKIVNKI